MADVAAGPKPEGAARWSRDLSDEDQPPVYVPGVSAERNFRSRSLLNVQKAEVKGKVPSAAAPVPMDASKSTGEVPAQQVPDKGGMKSASLKDLCPEDKRRIANLIKELARVSEEKEVTEERLKAEQESFEKKIRQLEEQNELIIKEREALQQQYRECQELLSLYQKYLSEQQEKLTHSLSELEAAKQKEQQMVNQRTVCQSLPSSELDGSYLSVARPQTLYKNDRMACGSSSSIFLAQPCRNGGVLGASPQGICQEDRNGFLLENGVHGKRNNLVSPPEQKVPPHVKRTPDMDPRKNSCPLQTCFFHQKPGNSEHSPFQDGCHTPKRYSSPRGESSADYSRPPQPVPLSRSADLRSKETERGKRLPEERRKELQLQKLELEIEKERLQNLLAKQEAKLLLQQQQLHQSRLDYNRFKGHTPHSEELVMDEVLMRPGSFIPVMNGTGGGLSSPRLNCEGCFPRTPTSRGACRASGSSRGSSSGKKSVGFGARAESETLWECPGKETVRPRRGTPASSPKAVAPSPGLPSSRKELVTTATSPIQPDTSRYDSSLLELVDAMSPGLQHQYGEGCSHHRVFAQQQSGKRRNFGWSLSPSRSTRRGTAELEESRILEEIFFI
nr:protein hinderin isoform X1 [Pogona vitticeps]